MRERRGGIQESFIVFPREEEGETERLYLGVSEITAPHLASVLKQDRSEGKEKDERARGKKNIVKER